MAEQKFHALQRIVPDVSRETFQRLLAFEALFLKWSKAFNLAAPSTLADLWDRHILDSAQLISIERPHDTWLDLGSGGGLPGVIMAIFMAEAKGGHVHLVESNGKKIAFLRSAISETGAAGTRPIATVAGGRRDRTFPQGQRISS
jgi:16S rRNA (guanine527-N7)-methyltransferase